MERTTNPQSFPVTCSVNPTESANLLNWYPFLPNRSLLQIGIGTGTLTALFCEKCAHVTVLEPDAEKAEQTAKALCRFDNLEIVSGGSPALLSGRQFDYITLIGTELSVAEAIGMTRSLLAVDGRYLIAVDNKFGLRFFAGNPENRYGLKFASLNGYAAQTDRPVTYTKTVLERELNELGLHTRFYYPLPDYRLPDVIFSDEYLPVSGNVDKYSPYYLEKSRILFGEGEVMREILHSDPQSFPLFANAFLVEAALGDCDRKYKYISFCNMRKPAYRLITKIADGYVEKQPACAEAEGHYRSMAENIALLHRQGIRTTDSVEDGVIRSRYTPQEYILSHQLAARLRDGDTEGFYSLVDGFLNALKQNAYRETEISNTAFAAHGIPVDDPDALLALDFVKDGLWDMTFDNCFLIDGEYVFFDQEWREPDLPVLYILYRSLRYTASIRSYVDKEAFSDRYGITPYLSLFRQLDDRTQEAIRDDDAWRFYSEARGVDLEFLIDRDKAHQHELALKQQHIENLEGILDATRETVSQQQAQIQVMAKELERSVLYRVRRKLKNMK